MVRPVDAGTSKLKLKTLYQLAGQRNGFNASLISLHVARRAVPPSAVRLGISTEKGQVAAPVGYDKFGYCYRSKLGSKFHVARGSPYGASYGMLTVP